MGSPEEIHRLGSSRRAHIAQKFVKSAYEKGSLS